MRYRKAMTAPLIAAVITAALAGCASLGGSPAAAPSATPSAPPCTSAACVTRDLQRTLIGTSVKDGSVFTALKCRDGTLKHNAGDTYTLTCTATYSDGSQWSGYGTLLAKPDEVTFEPETQLRTGS